MAPIYQEIAITWEGREYRITPTYAMIQKIEQRLSIQGLIERMQAEQAPLTQLADLIATVLQLAGCRSPTATGEAIYAEIYASRESALRISEAATRVIFGLLPQKVLQRGNEAPPTAPGEAQAISSGPNTIKSPLDTVESSLANSGK